MARKSDPRPWGRVIGLLTASGVTLIGVVRGLEPEIILVRAAAAALVLGMATALVLSIVPVLLKKTS